jgi:GT2 family glycosyltransferase
VSEQPIVYVIVLTWNGMTDTIECLKSLAGLSYPNVRVLMVDNASSDDTVAIVRREFPGVEVIVNESNLRFAGGNNVGIRHALERGAEYVLLLNNDTVVDPDFIGHLMRPLDQDPSAGMAAPKIYYFDKPKKIWFAGGRIEWWKGWISHIGIRENDFGQHDSIRRVDYLTACCILVKREVIDRIGMLDERYTMYGEDADWCIRAVRAGYELLYVPSAVVWHKISASSGGHLSWFKNWNKLKSQLRLMGRYAKPYHWATIPVAMMVNILFGFLRMRTHLSSR